jgi:hypothetical protein
MPNLSIDWLTDAMASKRAFFEERPMETDDALRRFADDVTGVEGSVVLEVPDG